MEHSLPPLPPKALQPFDYQEHLINQAEKRNSIIYLETGQGKTLIAARVVYQVLSQEYKQTLPFLLDDGLFVFTQFRPAVFIVPTNALVIQQQSYFQTQTGVSCVVVNGESLPKLRLLYKNGFMRYLLKHHVIVCTAGAFIELTKASELRFDQISMLVYDEAHSAKGQHPYSQVARSYRRAKEIFISHISSFLKFSMQHYFIVSLFIQQISHFLEASRDPNFSHLQFVLPLTQILLQHFNQVMVDSWLINFVHQYPNLNRINDFLNSNRNTNTPINPQFFLQFWNDGKLILPFSSTDTLCRLLQSVSALFVGINELQHFNDALRAFNEITTNLSLSLDKIVETYFIPSLPWFNIDPTVITTQFNRIYSFQTFQHVPQLRTQYFFNYLTSSLFDTQLIPQSTQDSFYQQYPFILIEKENEVQFKLQQQQNYTTPINISVPLQYYPHQISPDHIANCKLYHIGSSIATFFNAANDKYQDRGRLQEYLSKEFFSEDIAQLIVPTLRRFLPRVLGLTASPINFSFTTQKAASITSPVEQIDDIHDRTVQSVDTTIISPAMTEIHSQIRDLQTSLDAILISIDWKQFRTAALDLGNRGQLHFGAMCAETVVNYISTATLTYPYQNNPTPKSIQQFPLLEDEIQSPQQQNGNGQNNRNEKLSVTNCTNFAPESFPISIAQHKSSFPTEIHSQLHKTQQLLRVLVLNLRQMINDCQLYFDIIFRFQTHLLFITTYQYLLPMFNQNEKDRITIQQRLFNTLLPHLWCFDRNIQNYRFRLLTTSPQFPHDIHAFSGLSSRKATQAIQFQPANSTIPFQPPTLQYEIDIFSNSNNFPLNPSDVIRNCIDPIFDIIRKNQSFFSNYYFNSEAFYAAHHKISQLAFNEPFLQPRPLPQEIPQNFPQAVLPFASKIISRCLDETPLHQNSPQSYQLLDDQQSNMLLDETSILSPKFNSIKYLRHHNYISGEPDFNSSTFQQQRHGGILITPPPADDTTIFNYYQQKWSQCLSVPQSTTLTERHELFFRAIYTTLPTLSHIQTTPSDDLTAIQFNTIPPQPPPHPQGVIFARSRQDCIQLTALLKSIRCPHHDPFCEKSNNPHLHIECDICLLISQIKPAYLLGKTADISQYLPHNVALQKLLLQTNTQQHEDDNDDDNNNDVATVDSDLFIASYNAAKSGQVGHNHLFQHSTHSITHARTTISSEDTFSTHSPSFNSPTNSIVSTFDPFNLRSFASHITPPKDVSNSSTTPLGSLPWYLGGSLTSQFNVTKFNAKHSEYALNGFRNGMVNLLISTTVSEEGLDISQCSFVIFYNSAETIQQYIQRRGRARYNHARLYIFEPLKFKVDIINPNNQHDSLTEYQTRAFLTQGQCVQTGQTGFTIMLPIQQSHDIPLFTDLHETSNHADDHISEINQFITRHIPPDLSSQLPLCELLAGTNGRQLTASPTQLFYQFAPIQRLHRPLIVTHANLPPHIQPLQINVRTIVDFPLPIKLSFSQSDLVPQLRKIHQLVRRLLVEVSLSGGFMKTIDSKMTDNTTNTSTNNNDSNEPIEAAQTNTSQIIQTSTIFNPQYLLFLFTLSQQTDWAPITGVNTTSSSPSPTTNTITGLTLTTPSPSSTTTITTTPLQQNRSNQGPLHALYQDYNDVVNSVPNFSHLFPQTHPNSPYHIPTQNNQYQLRFLPPQFNDQDILQHPENITPSSLLLKLKPQAERVSEDILKLFMDFLLVLTNATDLRPNQNVSNWLLSFLGGTQQQKKDIHSKIDSVFSLIPQTFLNEHSITKATFFSDCTIVNQYYNQLSSSPNSLPTPTVTSARLTLSKVLNYVQLQQTKKLNSQYLLWVNGQNVQISDAMSVSILHQFNTALNVHLNTLKTKFLNRNNYPQTAPILKSLVESQTFPQITTYNHHIACLKQNIRGSPDAFDYFIFLLQLAYCENTSPIIKTCRNSSTAQISGDKQFQVQWFDIEVDADVIERYIQLQTALQQPTELQRLASHFYVNCQIPLFRDIFPTTHLPPNQQFYFPTDPISTPFGLQGLYHGIVARTKQQTKSYTALLILRSLIQYKLLAPDFKIWSDKDLTMWSL